MKNSGHRRAGVTKKKHETGAAIGNDKRTTEILMMKTFCRINLINRAIESINWSIPSSVARLSFQILVLELSTGRKGKFMLIKVDCGY